MRSWIVATAYGLWLFSLTEVFYLANGEAGNALQFAVMTGFVPVIMQFFIVGIDTIGLMAPAKFCLILMLVILLSLLGNIQDWTPVFLVCDMAFVLGIALAIAGSPDRRLPRQTAAVFCLFTGLFLLFINFEGEYVWGRLSAHGIQPNFWGTIALSVAVAGLGARRLPLMVFGVGVALLTFYNASARGSLVAFLAAGSIALVVSVLNLRGPRLVIAVAAMGMALGMLAVTEPYISDVFDTVAVDVFKVNDPARGLDSGFTGRTVLWEEAVGLWKKSPLFGIGFHQSEVLLDAPAHNGYLAMLSETGIVGFLLYIYLLGWAFVAGLGLTDRPSLRLVLSTVVGYSVYGFFEARAFNIANPMSLLFLICCFYALADQQRRRALMRSRPEPVPVAILSPSP